MKSNTGKKEDSREIASSIQRKMLCFSRHDLTKHNANVHKQDPRPYRCEHCGRQFSTSAYLSQHRRIHLGVKPYACRFCDRRFTQLSHVQQHERIHTGDKPYKCCTCYKCFTQMSNLQSHQRQHMKGKPCRCEHCFMCFDVQEELDTHIQAKHAGHKYSKVLMCPICAKNYNSETYLNKHILKHKESAMGGHMSLDLQQPPPAHQGLKMKTETNPCSPLGLNGGIPRVSGVGGGGPGMDMLLGNTPASSGGLGGPASCVPPGMLSPACGTAGGGVNGLGMKDRQHNMFSGGGVGGAGSIHGNNANNNNNNGSQRSMTPNSCMGGGGGGNGGNKLGPFCAPRVSSSVSAVDPFCMQYPGSTNQRLPAGFNPAAVAYSALMDHHHHNSSAGVVPRETPYDMIPPFTFPNFRF